MKTIDLRSDTVTRPTKEMLEFMFSAKVGDDVFGEDPTINQLEEKAAAIFGMGAAIFCPSGTMTNQIGIKVLSQSPGELICDKLSHVYQYEGGGIAFNSGLSVNLLDGNRGRINALQIREAINPKDIHKAPSQLVSIENTCNRGGGSIYSLEDMREISAFCKTEGLNLHLDGARIFNAIVASNYTASEIGPLFNTISVCLSKGLGCPVGSLLIGSKEIVMKARRIRKVLGGGMRQAGFLAAAGIYALDHHVDRLLEDHKKARFVEGVLKELSAVETILPVETNILVFQLKKDVPSAKFIEYLKSKGVLAVPFGPQQIRFTFHLDVDNDQVEELSGLLRKMPF